MQLGHKGHRDGAPVVGILEGLHHAHHRVVERISLPGLPAALPVVGAGAEQPFHRVFGHDDIRFTIGIVRQLLHRRAALSRPEAIRFEEMGMGPEVNMQDVELRRVALRRQGRTAVSHRARIDKGDERRGLLHIGILAGPLHEVQISLHHRGRVGSLVVIARRLRLECGHRHHAEAVGIVAKRKVTVVGHHNDGVEDNP